MQRLPVARIGRSAATHHRLAASSSFLARSMLSAALAVSTRGFVQGAPPMPKPDIEKIRQQHTPGAKKPVVEEKHQIRQRELHEYFATHEPNCPEPLEENAFVKGQFGMRRRYFVDHRDKLDPTSLNDALADSTNAMRK